MDAEDTQFSKIIDDSVFYDKQNSNGKYKIEFIIL